MISIPDINRILHLPKLGFLNNKKSVVLVGGIMRLKRFYIPIICSFCFILSGFDNKEPVKVSIVSTSITKQGLGYDIKLRFLHCNERCKTNLHLKVKPGFDLKSLMKSNGKELFLLNESKYI